MQEAIKEQSDSQKIDQRYYKQFISIEGIQKQPHDYLAISNLEEQEAKFLSGELENPEFEYDKLQDNQAVLEQRMQALYNFRSELKTRKHDLMQRMEQDLEDLSEEELAELKEEILVVQLYLWKTNEKIAEIKLLFNAMDLSGSAKDSKKRRQLERNFMRWNKLLYGEPQLAILNVATETLKSDLGETADGSFEKLGTFLSYLPTEDSRMEYVIKQPEKINTGIQIKTRTEILNNLKSLLKERDRKAKDIARPDQQTFSDLRNDTFRNFHELLKVAEEQEGITFSDEEVKMIFSEALQELGLEKRWKVVIEEGRVNMAVDQQAEKIKLPKGMSRTKERMRELLVHEIGTHILRKMSGEETKLMLLSVGLDRYAKGDEGVATAREQALTEEFRSFAAIDRYLAIALATGIDGNARNFREVFEIMQEYYLQQATQPNPELANARVKEKAAQDAWKLCVRVFRGTDCRARGVCFTKDMLYMEGNARIWRVISENRTIMHKMSIGRFDPANTRHKKILDELNLFQDYLIAIQPAISEEDMDTIRD